MIVNASRSPVQREIGRSVFRNRIIRFVRSLTDDKAPVEVVVDLWKIEGKQFPTVQAAREFAHDYVKQEDANT